MATQSPLYLSGEEPGTLKANQETEAALERLLQNLEARQKKMFDPELLALAQGFLAPTKTGSFGESLGYAAGNLREAQQKSLEEQQKLDETRISLATKRMELERQKARERAFEQLGGMGAPAAGEAPTGAPGAIPSGAPGQASAATPVSAAGVAQGVAQAGAGRLAAPERVLSRREFMALQQREGTVSAAQAESNWAEYQKRVAETQRGRAEAEKALAETGERQIYGSTYRVPLQIARQLDDAQTAGDMGRYRAVADQFLSGVGAPPRSVAASDIEKAAELERQKVLAAESAKMEANAPQMRDTAMQIRAATDRIRQDLQAAPDVFGVFERPNLAAAFGRLIDEGLAVGTTRVNMGGFRQAVTQALPGMTQDKLDALMRFAGNKAELELLFRRKYLSGQGQGAISNMEQAMIPNMIGSEKDTAQVLNDKVRLLSMRAQFDLKEHELWRQMSRANRGLTYLQFRNSDEYERMVSEYDQALRQTFERSAAGASVSAPASGSGQTAPVRPLSPASPPPVVTPAAPRGAPYPGALRRLDSQFPPSR